MTRDGGLDIEQHGVEQTATDLKELGRRSQQLKRISERVRSVYRESETHQFSTEGRGHWPRLADSTRERKSREGLSSATLRATDTLYRSLTATRASNQIDERTNEQFRFGTSVYYARFHDTGKGVPQRKLIDLTQRERHAIVEIIQQFIRHGRTRGVSQGGFGE